MRELVIILKIKLQMFLNYLKRVKFYEIIKFFLFSGIAIFFFFGLYIGFYRIFAYLETVPLIGKVLTLKLLSMIFLVFFLMLIFSSLITSLTTSFFAKDLFFLFSSPVKPGTIFLYKFGQTIFYSSWMVGITLLPLLLAFGQIKQQNFFFYLIFLLLSLFFFFIAGSVGIILSTFLICLFPTAKLRNIFFIFIVLFGGGIYLLIRLLQPEQLANPDKLTEIIQYLVYIQAPTATYLPSWWLSGALNSYLTFNLDKFLFYTFLLLGSGLLFFLTLLGLGKSIYPSAWLDLQGKGIKFALKRLEPVERRRLFLPGLSRKLILRGWRSLLIKDIKTFLRDSNQWIQIFLLIPLLTVYFFNLYKLPLDTFYLKSLVAFLNIGLAGFVLAAVVLRFIFPAISLEGQNFWILRSAPLRIKEILWAKFLFTFLPVFIFAGIISCGSNWLLKVDSFVYSLSSLTIFLFAFSLSGLGMGLGAVYPKFKVENIPQIETSSGGILYMLTALFYIGLTLSLLAWPLRMHFYQKIDQLNPFGYPVVFWTLFSFLILSLLTFFLPIFWGIKKLNNLEE